MSKNWYPKINYEKCTECGSCVDMCQHGVYDKEKAPHPDVVYPEGCIEKCKGCGSICPNGAIKYFRDDEEYSTDECCCGDSCSCDADCGCDEGCNC